MVGCHVIKKPNILPKPKMMPGRVLFSDLDPCKKDGDNKLITKDMLQKSKTHGQAILCVCGCH